MLLLTLDHISEIGFRLLLWITYLYLNKWAPFIKHIEEEELWYYRYPSVPSIIPLIYLYLVMIGIPLLVYIISFLCSKKETIYNDLRNQFYGISLAYGINAVLTALLKVIIGRPRPNFFYRCFPDGVGIDIQNCTGDWGSQMDGRKSFPSAHSSFSFTGMVYITLYMFNEYDFSHPCFARGVIFFLALLPIILAIVISLSRFCDYHHHMSDVVGGGIIGTSIALLVFHYYSEYNIEKDRKYLEKLRELHVADMEVE
ncbi:phospholipid phosphatase 5 [Anoplophora glabripennis]|uniref:phospholipid phosphatase 5 n=1 Tax=Anoplophora glabripennis TaxID=217634 RepID=UPI000875A5B1|nr:phospholipid phosphatase 5 [Anoplophora glabripennis]